MYQRMLTLLKWTRVPEYHGTRVPEYPSITVPGVPGYHRVPEYIQPRLTQVTQSKPK